MAAWFEPQMGGFAPRADCVAQIVTDINSYISTDADGQSTFNIQQFMQLAATRLAAIPDPSPPFIFNAPELLRSVNVRPTADKLLADLGTIAADNIGSTDLTTLLLDLEAKAAAVTKYYDAAYSERAADLVIASLSSGPIDKNMPEAEDTTKETRYYRTTWVDDWAVESAPSEVSAAVEVGKKDTVTVTVGTVPSSRNITHWRGYRSNSGNEAAAFQYVPYPTDDNGVPIASTTVTDNVANSALQEVCPTTIWNEPPSNLQGLIGLANGIHLGFFGNTLCPSETNIPYAYPQDYRMTVEWPIVGLAAWDQGAFCLTRGQPYFVSGADAASLTARKIDAEQACVSARSICSTSRGVVYASPDGLCLATPDGVTVLTAAHFTREEWQALDLTNLIVREQDGVLYLFQYDADPTALPAYLWATVRTGSGGVLSESNALWTDAAGGDGEVWTGTALAGKVYAEFVCTQRTNDTPTAIGIGDGVDSAFFNVGHYVMYSGAGGCGLGTAGLHRNGSNTTSSTYRYEVGDVIGVAFDATGKLWFRKNGTWLSGDPAAGTSPSATFTPGTWYFYAGNYACPDGAASVRIIPNDPAQTYDVPSGFTSYQP